VNVLSKDTAVQIAYAHREIETAENLLAEMKDSATKVKNLDYRDSFGQRANIQLQVPMSGSGGSLMHRLFDIRPELAVAVIEAHVADCRARLQILSEKAKSELGSEVAA